MNKVFLVGRLAADPQPYTTTNGTQQSKITLACNDIRQKNESYFFPCVAWQNQATFINTYLKKGDLVSVDGKLTRRSYVDKNGKTNYVTEVIIDAINSLGNRRNGDQPTQSSFQKQEPMKSIDASFPEQVVSNSTESKPSFTKSNQNADEVEWFDEIEK